VITGSRSLVLGLDFGGTKVAAGLVASDGGKVQAALRQPTDSAGGAEAALDQMLGMASRLLPEATAPVAGVGINFGGPVDAVNGVVLKSHHLSGWDGFHLAGRIAARLQMTAVLENDANGQALAEWRFGAGRGARDVAYLNLGTGIGGGIVRDGRLYRGAHGLAGELGHLVIRPDGPRCTCGRRGCLEALCAGPAMGRRARELLATLDPEERQTTALVRRAGAWGDVTGKELTAEAAEGDALALQILDAVLADLAIGLVDVYNAFDPDLIVLGGGAADLSPDLFARLRRHVLARCLPGTEQYLRVEPAALGADAGILGGAAAFLDR